MDRLIELARSMLPAKFTVARVRARGDDPSLYLVQVSGREQDMVARSETIHAPGDDVMVLLEPNVHAPSIVGAAPWASNYALVSNTNNGQPWTAADIAPGGLDAAIARNASLRVTDVHARGHSFTSSADHSDVSGTPGDGDLLRYDGSTWRPVHLAVTLDGGVRA